MSCMSAIYDRLNSYEELQNYVGAFENARIYPARAPADVTTPYIVYSIVYDRSEHYLGGASGLVESAVQIDIHGSTMLICESVWNAVRNALDGWRDAGVLPPIRGCMRQSYRTEQYDVPDGNDTALFKISADFLVHYAETVPALEESVSPD